MDNDKQQNQSQPSSNGGDRPRQVAPTAPVSATPKEAPAKESAPTTGESDPHEYHEIADGVEARRMTDEERAERLAADSESKS